MLGTGVDGFLKKRKYWQDVENCKTFCQDISDALRAYANQNNTLLDFSSWNALDLSLSFCCCHKVLDEEDKEKDEEDEEKPAKRQKKSGDQVNT